MFRPRRGRFAVSRQVEEHVHAYLEAQQHARLVALGNVNRFADKQSPSVSVDHRKLNRKSSTLVIILNRVFDKFLCLVRS